MPNARLGHDRDRNCLLDFLDHLGIAHAGYAALLTDIRGDALERHDSHCTCFLRDFCFLRGGDVHNHAALKLLRQILTIFLPHVSSLLIQKFPSYYTPKHGRTQTSWIPVFLRVKNFVVLSENPPAFS